MKGYVSDLRALLPVTFRLAGQPDIAIACVVDTGFNGFLTLPYAAITALNLTFIEEISANLASDSDVKVDVYKATIIWKGMERDVRVLAMGKRPLLGTALLADCQLLTQFVEGGLVSVEDLLAP